MRKHWDKYWLIYVMGTMWVAGMLLIGLKNGWS